MENMQNMGGGKMMCKCPHHKVVPVVIMLIGLAFLAEALYILPMNAVAIIWPIGLIVIGAMKFSKGMCKCC